MVNKLPQKIDLSQKGEKGILEATYILRCMLLVQETYPRRRRDNMFACNKPINMSKASTGLLMHF
jgi:hypothetical protein